MNLGELNCTPCSCINSVSRLHIFSQFNAKQCFPIFAGNSARGNRNRIYPGRVHLKLANGRPRELTCFSFFLYILIEECVNSMALFIYWRVCEVLFLLRFIWLRLHRVPMWLNQQCWFKCSKLSYSLKICVVSELRNVALCIRWKWGLKEGPCFAIDLNECRCLGILLGEKHIWYGSFLVPGLNPLQVFLIISI